MTAQRRTPAALFLLLRAAPLVFVVLTVAVDAAPLSSYTQAKNYLSQYGYLPPSVKDQDTLISEDTLKEAITEFQTFAGLNVTGEIDEETAHTMSLPRCGVKDKVGYGTDSRTKRYALQGSRWRVKDLTYRISKYPSTARLSKWDVDREIRNAFDVWSSVTDLTFTQKTRGQVHIEIRFEKGAHGDDGSFDGPGGNLAHAYFPNYGGDAHFDDSEAWTIRSFQGTNLFQVAAHEFGHSLGLGHSQVRSALMAAFYTGYIPDFRLDWDDIRGIQALYGRKSAWSTATGSSTPSSTEKSANEDPSLCNEGSIDTIFNSAEGETYVFKGDEYWKLIPDGVAIGYPRSISSSWKGLPGSIDAAFTYHNGKTYFFKGDQYWKYVGTKMDGDYPKPISESFTGIPDNLDAAMVWSGDSKIYFFKGSKFWRFDPEERSPVQSSYPKPISNWKGVPDNLDAALQYTDGHTYFFKNNAYYRFNDRTFAVDIAEPSFPRSAGHWWFGCSSQTHGTYKPGNSDFNWISQEQQRSGVEGSVSAPVPSNEQYDHHNQSLHSDVEDIILDAAERESESGEELASRRTRHA